MLIFYLCRCFAGSTIPQVCYSISLPWVGSELTILDHMTPSVLLTNVSASLFDLHLCHPSFSSLPSALQVPVCFASSSATNVTQIAHFHCPMPQKCPTPIPAAHITDVTLNASEVQVCACWRLFIASLDPSVHFSSSLLAWIPSPFPPTRL